MKQGKTHIIRNSRIISIQNKNCFRINDNRKQTALMKRLISPLQPKVKYEIYNETMPSNENVGIGYNARAPIRGEWKSGNSTWHHIVPRNELKRYLKSIHGFITKLYPITMTRGLYPHVIPIIDMGCRLGLDRTGHPTQDLGQKYYCIKANGFLGPASSNRNDDPHDGRETKAPYMFPKNQWDHILKWAYRMNILDNTITTEINKHINDNNELYQLITKIYLDFYYANAMYEKLANYGAYRTFDIDWIIDGMNHKYSLRD